MEESKGEEEGKEKVRVKQREKERQRGGGGKRKRADQGMRALCSLSWQLSCCVCLSVHARTHMHTQACAPGRLRLGIKIIGAASVPRPPLKEEGGEQGGQEGRREGVTKC